MASNALEEERDEGVSHADFTVPALLGGRVDFWIDIFTKYGKHQVVLHHRDYPQVIFKVLDFTNEALLLSPVLLERHIERMRKAEALKLKVLIGRLASGAKPTNAAERTIATQMNKIGGGLSRYRKVVNEDLIRGQTGIKEKFADAIRRSGRYLPLMERIFAEYGLPIELTRLPFVESSFDYTAYSSVGAAGIWQFMPRTARLFMRITSAVDERRDPISATHGAARYLKQAYRSLGTWPLALTSYNHGVYGVTKAARRMGTKDIGRIIEHEGDRVFGFASNNFFPEFLAALEVYAHRKRYFPNVVIEPPLEFDEIRLKVPHSVPFIQQRLGLEKEELEKYNYAILKNGWTGRASLPAGYTLKVRRGLGHLASRLQAGEPVNYAEAVASSASTVYGGVTYRVRRGDTLQGIAKRYRTSVSSIRELNDLQSDRLSIGQSLRIKQPVESRTREVSSPAETVQSSIVSEPAASGATRYYTIRSGDTLGAIAKKHGTSAATLSKLNGLRSSRINPGMRLRLPAPRQVVPSKATPSAVTPSSSHGKRYRVKAGDSLWSISRQYDVTLQALRNANKLRANRLAIGDELIIP
jgi:membrane-bound lytic murein transglycosylase D